MVPSIIVLLAHILSISAQNNFGYHECKRNVYKAKCLREYVRLERENLGLRTFPEITQQQTCLLLKNNQISDFPSDLTILKHIVTLDLSNNRVSNLPNNLHVISKLEILDLSQNRLRSLSPSTGFPDSLRGLLLAGNELSTIPAGFQIPSLFVLDFSQNQFTDIPEHFCVSNQLIRVDFSSNPLNYDISRYIGNLNKCRNKNNIPFCLFTDHDYIECDCSILESVMFGNPSFTMGASDTRTEMQCGASGKADKFTGRKLFDFDMAKLVDDCNITISKSTQQKSYGNRNDAVWVLTFLISMVPSSVVLY